MIIHQPYLSERLLEIRSLSASCLDNLAEVQRIQLFITSCLDEIIQPSGNSVSLDKLVIFLESYQSRFHVLSSRIDRDLHEVHRFSCDCLRGEPR